MPPTHTAYFQTAALKATDLDAVEKVNVGLETELVKKHVNIIADAPEIRIQDKTGSAPEVNATTMSIVADGGTTHFRAGTTTFAEGTETKGNVKFQSSTGATTHAEIVGSSGTLELQDGGLGLKLGSNVSVSGTPSAVIQEITGPHARESAVLKKYPEVPLTSNVQSGYVASASSEYSINYQIWKAHDGDTILGTAPSYYYSAATQAYSTSDGSYTGATYSTTSSGTAYAGEYVQMQFPKPIKLSHVRIVSPDAGATYNKNSPKQGVICGSNDGTTWTTIAAYSGITYAKLGASAIIQAPSNVAYKYIRLVATHIEGVGSTGWFVIEELEYYGYEDVGAGDDSVDTTVKSVYNTPDLTNAALYIDGKKSGSTPTDYSGSSVTVTDNGTWDSSDNTWSLSGTTTSNIVSGNLASLVGDQPHSVSAWVKADQLNGDGLFHVGTAEGEGDAASRVGFVDDSHISWGGEDHFFSNGEWHNITYTYNGKGSDKRLYLDGRLVGTAKNEDTFGDYPGFSMSGYSQYGYVVSASAVNNNYPPYYVFDDQTSFPNIWISSGSFYTTSSAGGVSNGGAITVVDGVNKGGEWVQIEFPFKLNVDYVAIKPPRSADADRAPQDGFIVGSNDGITWTSLREWTGITTWGTNETVAKNLVMTKNGFYKYFRLIVTRLQPNNTNQQAHITEIQYYGHRENDLVRFPDPTNVLKYPHITVDEPAKRGYAVSQSSQLLPSTGGSTGYYHGYNVFDGKVNVVNQNAWISMNGGNSTPLLYDTNGDPTAAAADTVVDGTTTSGEWVQLKLPRKIKLSYLRLMPPSEGGTTLNRAPAEGVLAGSTDGTTWTAISSWTGASYSDLQYNTFTANIDSTNSYDYLRLIVKKTGGATLTSIQELEFYGTESGDVVARIGDGFDGKVRNLRVYSTALSDARVQEIFDADKDEFGLAKSSISVYRGRLGTGTSKPKGALTVMDEVGELIQLPPGNMTADDQYFEKHGVFKARTSPGHITSSYPPWEGFNDRIGTLWYTGYSDSSASYNGTGGTYSGTAQLGATTKLGEYLVLEMPYKVFPKRMEYIRQSSGNHVITTAYVYGRNGSNGIWTEIGSFTDAPTKDWVPKVVHLNNSEAYDQLAFVPTKRYAASATAGVSCHHVRYFGTREQGASTLHNGELSLTRNLTVPRIGPPLDADDTPRRDRLVVEYNTTTDPTVFSKVVKDTSGRGLDGKMVGMVYKAADKSFVSTASDGSQWIDTRIHSGGSRLSEGISGSIWVNLKYFDTSSKNSFIWSVGDRSGTGNNREIAVGYNIVGGTLKSFVISFVGGSGNFNLSHTSETPFGVWTHVGMTYDGRNVKLYINGVYSVSTTSTDLNIPETNCFLRLNGDVVSANSTHQGTPMSLSNFKLYDVALTAKEVKRLYDMGRYDEGHHTTAVSRSKLQMSGEQLILEPCVKGFYEEGTWTPLIGGHTSGHKTPGSSNYGWFIRVGNLVTIGGTVAWNGGDNLVGHIVIDGLPYPATSTVNARSAMSFGVVGGSGITTSSGYDTLRLVLDPGYSYIWLIQANEEGSTTVTYSHSLGVASSGQIYGIGGSYRI